MHEYTINKCAEMIEKDRATLARALRTIPPDAGTPKRPLYRLATVVRALIAYEIKPDGRRGNGDEARLAAERARLAREQADAVALKNAVARRELIHRELVVRSGQIIVAAFRERCLAVPGKLAVFGPEAKWPRAMRFTSVLKSCRGRSCRTIRCHGPMMAPLPRLLMTPLTRGERSEPICPKGRR